MGLNRILAAVAGHFVAFPRLGIAKFGIWIHAEWIHGAGACIKQQITSAETQRRDSVFRQHGLDEPNTYHSVSVEDKSPHILIASTSIIRPWKGQD